MRKKGKLFTAAALSAALICILPVAGNAADIDITKKSISFEEINKDWEEVSDQNTLHTFTNGTDVITVLKFYDYKDLPSPAKVSDKYEAVYQTFYSTGDEIYVVTGSAAKKDGITEVKNIIDSILYPEEASTKTDKKNSGSSSGQSSEASTAASGSKPQTDSSQIPEQGWDSIVLYDIHLNGVEVTRGNDDTGNWYDANGVSYGNLDEADESAPIYNSNGEAYYWNGAYAQEAANASSGSDADAESTDITASINDPYDLYSWDAGTNSYIPYQQAESDASPIGRGNGWYYFDAASGGYLPW